MNTLYIAGNFLIVNDGTRTRQFPTKHFEYGRGLIAGVDTIEFFGIYPGLYENIKFTITDATVWQDDSAVAYTDLDEIEAIGQKLAGRNKIKRLLDVYPNTVGESFALHQVNSNFVGDVIELKRDDGTAQRYAFDGNELPIATMSTFVGAGDGKVTWWKGQANGLEVSQTSDGACPLLFENGVLIEENVKPTLKFSGAQYLDGLATLGNGSYYYVVSVGSLAGVETIGNVFESYSVGLNNTLTSFYDNRSLKRNQFFRGSSENSFLADNNDLISANQLYILSGIRNNSDLTAYLNSVTQNTTSGLDSLGNFDKITIGRRSAISLLYHTGNISEVHFYDDNQSANRKLIEDLINTRYNAYVV